MRLARFKYISLFWKKGCCDILETLIQKECTFGLFSSLLDYIVPEVGRTEVDKSATDTKSKKKGTKQANLELQVKEQVIEQKKENPKITKKIAETDNVEDDLIEDSEEELDLDDDSLKHLPDLAYSFSEEQFLLENIYGKASLDYLKLWYGENKPANFEQDGEYVVEGFFSENNDTYLLSTEEAKETFMEVQYASLLGTSSEMNREQLRKFDLWIKFNHSLYKLIESMNAMTRNVNYSSLT